MLTKEDVLKLFDLLERLHSGKKQQRDKVSVAVWAEVLRPWNYEQVRDAAVRRARVNRYFPDPSELAEYLPEPAASAVVQRGRYIDGQVEALRRQWNALREQRAAAGLPIGGCQALEQGWGAGQYEDAVDSAGLSLCIERAYD